MFLYIFQPNVLCCKYNYCKGCEVDHCVPQALICALPCNVNKIPLMTNLKRHLSWDLIRQNELHYQNGMAIRIMSTYKHRLSCLVEIGSVDVEESSCPPRSISVFTDGIASTACSREYNFISARRLNGSCRATCNPHRDIGCNKRRFED